MNEETCKTKPKDKLNLFFPYFIHVYVNTGIKLEACRYCEVIIKKDFTNVGDVMNESIMREFLENV